MRWAYPAVESFLGNQGQAHAHVNRKIIPLPRCVFQNLCEPVASLSTGQFCLSVVPLETLFPVTVRGWGGGGETRGGGVRVPSASPTPLLSVVRSAPSWGWGPRPMLPRIPPGPSPAARGSGILAKSRRAGSIRGASGHRATNTSNYSCYYLILMSSKRHVCWWEKARPRIQNLDSSAEFSV